MKITRIEGKGVRGKTFDIGLENRQIIVGPNGIGKSAVAAALQFIFVGHLPGYRVGQMADNMSDDEMWATVTLDNGGFIKRTLTRGKKLQEFIDVNGNSSSAGKGGTVALTRIKDALGPNLMLVDTDGLMWDVGPTQRRSTLLKATGADPAELNALTAEISKLKEQKKGLLDGKRDAEGLLKQLAEQIGASERPAGSIPQLKADIEEANQEIAAVNKRMVAGREADSQRALLKDLLKKTPEQEQLALDLATKVAEAKAGLQGAQGAELTQPKRPGSDVVALADDVKETIEGCANVLDTLRKEADVEPEFREQAMQLHEQCLVILKDQEELAMLADRQREWDVEQRRLQDAINAATRTLSDAEYSLGRARRALDSSRGAQTRLDNLPPGLNPDDEKLLVGIKQRRDEMAGRLGQLTGIQALEASMEQARIKVQKADTEVSSIEGQLTKVIDKQSAIVKGFTDTLTQRSQEILPVGELAVDAHGDDFDIAWRRDDLLVMRTTLSGGEQAVFDCAVQHALSPTAMILLEAAEMDAVALHRFMAHTNIEALPEPQIIAFTCHPVDEGHAKECGYNVITMME